MDKNSEKTMDPAERRERAMQNFYSGFNCCQSVVLAFEDLFPFDRETLLHLSSSFGAGMGRLREVCGAVSGMFMIAGVLYGTDDTSTLEEKGGHYRRIQELAGEFLKAHKSLYCRELLNLPPGPSDPMPAPRTPEYYKTRPCAKFIGDAAYIIADYVKKNS